MDGLYFWQHNPPNLASFKPMTHGLSRSFLHRRIDGRHELSRHIESITGIRFDVLWNGFIYTVRTISAAEKMSWAAKRQTTRPEDIAYCLLGPFDFNMPLLYGEGSTKAFVKLQQEFLRNSEDDSIFAWWLKESNPATQNKIENYNGLLAPSPKHFADSGDIRQIGGMRFDTENHPTEITNRGLRLRLSLYPIPDDPSHSSYFALLHCQRESRSSSYKAGRFVVLILQRLSALGNSFTRIVPHIKAYMIAKRPDHDLKVCLDKETHRSSDWEGWDIPTTSRFGASSILVRSSKETGITNYFCTGSAKGVTVLTALQGDLKFGLHNPADLSVVAASAFTEFHMVALWKRLRTSPCCHGTIASPPHSTAPTIRTEIGKIRTELMFRPRSGATAISTWGRSFDIQFGLEFPCANVFGTILWYSRPWYKLSPHFGGGVDNSSQSQQVVELPDGLVMYVNFLHVIKGFHPAYQIDIVVDYVNSTAAMERRRMDEVNTRTWNAVGIVWVQGDDVNYAPEPPPRQCNSHWTNVVLLK